MNSLDWVLLVVFGLIYVAFEGLVAWVWGGLPDERGEGSESDAREWVWLVALAIVGGVLVGYGVKLLVSGQ